MSLSTVLLAFFLTCSLLASAFAAAGSAGLLGVTLGISTGAFGAYALYLTVKLLRAGPTTSTGVLFTVMMFVTKFPVIGLGAYLSFAQGFEGLVAFVGGVLVVYFALVWRAARYGLYPQ